MSFTLDRVHVWAGEVEDKAGGVAAKLSALAESGANLEYIYSFRIADKPGHGMLFVAPLSGPNAVKAAKHAGLHEVNEPIVLRVEGDNAAGLAHRLTHEWAVRGLSMRGLSMSVLGNKFIGYASFDSVGDANRAAAILGDLGAVPPQAAKG